MYRSPGDARKGENASRGQRGSTLIEVALAIAILTFALIAVASSFGTNAHAVGRARGLTSATHFLEEVLDSVASQPYDNLAALNGNVLYDHATPAQARFRVEIAVSQAQVDLQSIRLQLRDNRSGNSITKLVTYRSKR